MNESLSMTVQKILAGVLFAFIVFKVMDLTLDGVIKVPEKVTEAGGAAAAPAAPPAPDKPLAVRLAAANADHGKDLSSKCQSCHTFNDGGRTLVGPNLYGVVGRAKATLAGFSYSDAVKKLGGNWTYEDLDNWIKSPATMASGTKMTFAGLPDGQDRADLIAYLKSISPDAPAFPKPEPAAAAPAGGSGAPAAGGSPAATGNNTPAPAGGAPAGAAPAK